MQQSVAVAASSPSGARPRARTGSGDKVFEWLCRSAGIFVLILLGAIIVELFIGALPAFRAFGLAFAWTELWDPVTEEFGALVPIYGTVVTSILALLLAVPVAFGIAFFLTELAPVWLRRPVGTAVELLAAVVAQAVSAALTLVAVVFSAQLYVALVARERMLRDKAARGETQA